MRSSTAVLAALVLAAAPGAALAQAQAARTPAKPPKAKPAESDATVEGVTVTAGHPDVQTSIDSRSYTLGKDLTATTGSIADALRNVPSVAVDLQGNLSLRGDPNVTILVDGKPSPMFEGAGRADALQQFPADQIERVEVITNPSAAINPEGSGGVINLITKRSRGAGTTGSVYASAGSQGLKRAGLSFGYNSKALNVTGALSGNYQRGKFQTRDERAGLGPDGAPTLESVQDFIGRSLYRGPTGRLNFTYTVDPKTQITGGATYNELLLDGHPFTRFTDSDPDGTLVNLLTREGERRYLQIDTSLSAGWKHSFAGEGHSLSVDLLRNTSAQRGDAVLTTFQSIPPTATPIEADRNDADLRHTELKVAYARPLPKGATLKTGYELKRDDNGNDFGVARGPQPGALSPDPAADNVFRVNQTINAAYATYERPFGDLTMQAGLRLERVQLDLDQRTSGERNDQDYTRAYPSLHLAYKLDDERKLSASYSRRVQRPPPVLLNPRPYLLDPQNIQQGNPDLKPQDTHSFELGYEQHRGQNSVLATLYYRRNVDAFTPVLLNQGEGVFISTFDNLGRSQSVGLELVLSGRVTPKLTYSASSNLYWSEIDAGNLGVAGKRSGAGADGRVNLNWQVKPDDMVQVNAFTQGKLLTAQGFSEPVFVLNLGWRHKINARTSATLTVNDLLATNRYGRKYETETIRDELRVHPVSRALILRLDYQLGGGGKPAKEPGFDYEGGAAPSP